MTDKIVVNQVACNIVTGNQTIPLLGLSRAPKAVKFLLTTGTVNGTAVDGAVLGIGAATAFAQFALSVRAQNGVATSDTGRRATDADCVLIQSTTSNSADGQASFVSMSATEVVINWTNAPASAYLLTVIAYDCEDAYITTTTLPTTVNTSITITTGFEFDALFVASILRSVPGGGGDAKLSYGIATYDGTTIIQRGMLWATDSGAAPTAAGSYLSTAYIGGECNDTTGALIRGMETATVTSTGFNLTARTAGFAANAYVCVLAIRFSSARVYVGTVDSPTSTGTTTYTGPGWTPLFAETVGTLLTAVDTAKADAETDARAIGVTDGSRSYSYAFADQDGQATSDTQSLSNNVLLDMPQDTSTTGLKASFSAFTASGITFNYTVVLASARKLILFALESVSSPDSGTGGTTPAPSAALPVAKAFRSHSIAHRLTVSVYDSISSTGNYLFDLSGELNSYEHEINAFGGYWTARMQIADKQTAFEDWYENGLGRRIVTHSPDGEIIWEGFVNQIGITLGGLSITIGPVIEIVNKAKLAYSTFDTTLNAPATGIRLETAYTEDTTSQGRYGILSAVLSTGGATATTAVELRDEYLRQYAIPQVDQERTFGGSGSTPSITLDCLGYVHYFNTYKYNQTAASGTQNLSAKLAAIIAAEPNSFVDHSTVFITANTTAVPAYENEDKTAWALIKELVNMSDASDNKYIFGVTADRYCRYEAIPTEAEYFQRISDPGQRIMTASGQVIQPWNVVPGKWIIATDFLIGRVADATAIEDDPRAMFVETVRFSHPNSVSLKGAKVRRLDQKLARLGLSGIGG